jgi:holin-like protein
MKGFLLLTGFFLLGEGMVRGLDWAIPGAAVGTMLLLLALVWLGDRLLVPLEKTATLLVSQMSLFLLPPAVGLWFLGSLLADAFVPVTLAMLVSTGFGLVYVAGLMHWLERRQNPATDD